MIGQAVGTGTLIVDRAWSTSVDEAFVVMVSAR
jgi:hypothetical protein